MWQKGGRRVCGAVGGAGRVCSGGVSPVMVSPQTVEDLSEKHPTVHLVRAHICLIWRQAAAGDQLSEGLKGNRGEIELIT